MKSEMVRRVVVVCVGQLGEARPDMERLMCKCETKHRASPQSIL